jgi:hypothetical protein
VRDDSEQDVARAAEEAERAVNERAVSEVERAKAEAERVTAEAERVTADALTGRGLQEALRQLGVIYGGLILIAVYMVQPFWSHRRSMCPPPFRSSHSQLRFRSWRL